MRRDAERLRKREALTRPVGGAGPSGYGGEHSRILAASPDVSGARQMTSGRRSVSFLAPYHHESASAIAVPGIATKAEISVVSS